MSDSTSAPAPTVRQPWTIVQQFGGHERVAKHGYTAMPVALYQHLKELGMSSEELLTATGIRVHHMTPALPFPSYRRIATCTGLSRNTVYRCVKSLEQKGLLVVHRANRSVSKLDLSPLWDRLADVMSEASEALDTATTSTSIAVEHSEWRAWQPPVAKTVPANVNLAVERTWRRPDAGASASSDDTPF